MPDRAGLASNTATLTGVRAVGGRDTWLFLLTPGSAAMGWALLLLG